MHVCTWIQFLKKKEQKPRWGGEEFGNIFMYTLKHNLKVTFCLYLSFFWFIFENSAETLEIHQIVSHKGGVPPDMFTPLPLVMYSRGTLNAKEAVMHMITVTH